MCNLSQALGQKLSSLVPPTGVPFTRVIPLQLSQAELAKVVYREEEFGRLLQGGREEFEACKDVVDAVCTKGDANPGKVRKAEYSG